jgi:RNA polymerase sigma-70 factor (ECF subfamily)
MLFFGSGTDRKPNAQYESCIGKIAEGDTTALGELFASAKSAVYGFALSLTRNAQDAEDVLQDTFVSIYAHARNYRKQGKPMAWILTIARNLALMKLRERRKTAELPEADWRLCIPDGNTVSREDTILLDAALRKITPEESQIVLLHAVAGFKHREIAEVLELPLSTVLSKYNRAVKKLRLALEEAYRDGE